MRRGRQATTRPNHIGLAVLGSCVVVVVILMTSINDGSGLGTPGYWAWVLTGFQVVALRTAASGEDWGWLLGASVQLPWIAYALVTVQFGFIPGCIVSGTVQAHAYRRIHTARFERREPTFA